jgi:probable lipoprotein NlpC
MKKIVFYIIGFIALIVLLPSCRSSRSGSGSGSSISKKTKSAREEKASIILQTARSYTGTPWKLGGESKSGIDCSGLVLLSFGKAGIQMPRRSVEQSRLGKEVSEPELLPGDLLFFAFNKPNNREINHVGIVTRKDGANTYFIHTSRSKGVMESCLCEKYFREGFVKAKNIF